MKCHLVRSVPSPPRRSQAGPSGYGLRARETLRAGRARSQPLRLRSSVTERWRRASESMTSWSPVLCSWAKPPAHEALGRQYPPIRPPLASGVDASRTLVRQPPKGRSSTLWSLSGRHGFTLVASRRASHRLPAVAGCVCPIAQTMGKFLPLGVTTLERPGGLGGWGALPHCNNVLSWNHNLIEGQKR